MAGRKIGMLKKWREHTFRSESEKKNGKKQPKKVPGIRNSAEFRRNSGGIPNQAEPCEFLRRKLQRQTTNSHRRVVSRAV